MTKELVAEREGLKIYVDYRKPKRSGKERLWVILRQTHPKNWKVAHSLAYTKAVDIAFEKEQ